MPLKPITPMMAMLAPSLPEGPGWSYEVKWDGYRAEIVKSGPTVKIYSRNLKDLTPDYPHIASAGANLRDDPIIDGEIVALD